ncbi:MAG: hypothetical protein ACK40G_11060 [Cytophagaceae bacterium]
MIAGIQGHKLPSMSLVIPYFVFSSISFLAAAILIYISSESFCIHYFHPKLLAITHMLVLGFITSVIFGALFQMFPVIFNITIKSELLGKLTFVCLSLGTCIMVYCFWIFKTGMLFQLGGGLVLLSFILFSINFFKSAESSGEASIESEFISSSVIWLLLTGLVGLLLVINFTYPFIHSSHLEILKIHAHFGIVGWILLLVMGVSAKLVPMFVIAKSQKPQLLRYTYYLVNIGLIFVSLTVYFELSAWLTLFFIIMIIGGILLFLTFIFQSFKTGVRKNLGPELRLTLISFYILIFCLPIALVFPLKLFTNIQVMQLAVVYGLLILLGFSGALILGQSLKIFPFILWMHIHQRYSGKKKIPLPKELVSEKVTSVIMVLFLFGLAGLVIFVLAGKVAGIRLSSAALIVSALLYNLNIFKAFSYKIS